METSKRRDCDPIKQEYYFPEFFLNMMEWRPQKEGIATPCCPSKFLLANLKPHEPLIDTIFHVFNR
jgi:hypothetical protein